jgi:hypothetical protein
MAGGKRRQRAISHVPRQKCWRLCFQWNGRGMWERHFVWPTLDLADIGIRYSRSRSRFEPTLHPFTFTYYQSTTMLGKNGLEQQIRGPRANL